MANPPKILAFAGSTREASYNKKLVKIAAEGARVVGAEVRYIDLRELPMPLFEQDLEAKEGIPSNVRKFKDLMLVHQGLLIASPEYNGSITPLLKNAIDWASRPTESEPMLACFKNKVAAVMSASPGALGGLRGLAHIREILENIGVMVIPDQKAIPKAADAFNEDGSLKETRQQEAIAAIGAKLATVVTKLI